MDPFQLQHAVEVPQPTRTGGVERELKALVFRRSLAVLVGRVQELGLLGMYMSTDRPALTKHTVVEVGFSLGRPGPGQFIRLPAMIVRTNAHGMALIFDADDHATQADVRCLLRAWRG